MTDQVLLSIPCWRANIWIGHLCLFLDFRNFFLFFLCIHVWLFLIYLSIGLSVLVKDFLIKFKSLTSFSHFSSILTSLFQYPSLILYCVLFISSRVQLTYDIKLNEKCKRRRKWRFNNIDQFYAYGKILVTHRLKKKSMVYKKLMHKKWNGIWFLLTILLIWAVIYEWFIVSARSYRFEKKYLTSDFSK